MTNMDTGKLCPSSGQTTNIGQRQTNCQTESCRGYGSTGCTCRIRELNDRLRTTMSGGLVHMTNGVAALGLPTVNAIFKAISLTPSRRTMIPGASMTARSWRSKATVSFGRSTTTTGQGSTIRRMPPILNSRCASSPSCSQPNTEACHEP